MKYKKCGDCGANLGHGERCTCQGPLVVMTAAVVEEEPITDLIVIKQLPVIEERLKEISDLARVKIAEALALPCTDENIQAVRKVRAALRKDWDEYEGNRKDVDRQVAGRLAPFKGAFQEYITDVYGPADKELKTRIEALEDEKKSRMREEAKAFFDEYAKSKGIDFVSFDAAGIHITLSTSRKALREMPRAFLDSVADDLALINTQPHKAEIIVEYKRSLNVSQAITTVTERIAAVEAQKRRQEELAEQAQTKAAVVGKVDVALSPPVEGQLLAASVAEARMPVDDLNRVLTLKFPPIRGKKRDLLELKRQIEMGPFEIIKDSGGR